MSDLSLLATWSPKARALRQPSSGAPSSQLFGDLGHIVDRPEGRGDHQVKPVALAGLHLAVEAKEDLAGGPRQPLVAIDERGAHDARGGHALAVAPERPTSRTDELRES